MGVLIDDLLTFSRLSRLPLNKRPVTRRGWCGTPSRSWVHSGKGGRLKSGTGDLPPCHGDPALLKQIWVNLLSNALKYTRKRDIAMIEIGGKREGDEQVYFVRDNGTGFDMRYVGKLFGVFQRLQSRRGLRRDGCRPGYRAAGRPPPRRADLGRGPRRIAAPLSIFTLEGANEP